MQEVVYVLFYLLAYALCHCAVVPVLPFDVIVGFVDMR
jgi:hypothetical protein